MNIQPLIERRYLLRSRGRRCGLRAMCWSGEPAAILKDLKEGMVSHWAAQNVYKIIYDEKTLRLDEEKTRTLREQVRKERISRGKPFDEFEAQWEKLRPSDQTIKHYGAYPHPSEGPPGSPGM